MITNGLIVKVSLVVMLNGCDGPPSLACPASPGTHPLSNCPLLLPSSDDIIKVIKVEIFFNAPMLKRSA